jgi:imidazolonepropionase-like amidohydrolase
MGWIKNGALLDVGAGRFEHRTLRLEGDRIAEISSSRAPSGEAIDLDGLFVLPGFFDCHVHLCMRTEAADPNDVWRGALPGTIAIYAAEAAKRTLRAGITTARDVGGWDYHEIAVREAIRAGLIEGPRLFCSGRILTITSSTTPYYRGMYEEADAPDAVRGAARHQLAAGADFIKLLATGAITSTEYERADAIQYRLEEIAAAVEIATDNFTYVAAHAHALQGIRNAVQAGCRSVEHGSYGDEAVYRLMAERGVFLVPTLCITQAMFQDRDFAALVPKHVRERYATVHEIRARNIALAHRCGVPIAMGTDAGTPGNHHGRNMQELCTMVSEAGFSPIEAIRSATVDAARLMRLADDLGALEPGKLSDIIAVPRNPLEDIAALDEVCFVMKAGRVVRDDQARARSGVPRA